MCVGARLVACRTGAGRIGGTRVILVASWARAGITTLLWMDGWMDEHIDGWREDGRKDGRRLLFWLKMGGWMDGMDGRADGGTDVMTMNAWINQQ